MLRDAVDWSYHLLSQPEQHLFEGLAVFMGGWTLEAAKALVTIDANEPGSPFDTLFAKAAALPVVFTG